MEKVKSMVEHVNNLTKLAMSSPSGMEQVAIQLNGIEIASNSEADVMQGIAEKILPDNWEWTIREVIGGHCSLIIISTG
jgi:hypothetical protein